MENDTIITNKLMIADKFNDFFTNIGPDLAKKIIAPKNKTFKSYLNVKLNHHFVLKNIDKEMVNSIIDKLAPKTSFGFDGLST